MVMKLVKSLICMQIVVISSFSIFIVCDLHVVDEFSLIAVGKHELTQLQRHSLLNWSLVVAPIVLHMQLAFHSLH